MVNGIDILKEMGLQDVIINPDFSDFVRWFSELNEENYLRKNELAKFNEMKAAGAFNGDAESANKPIEQSLGRLVNDVAKIEELQDECDDLKDVEEALEDMLSIANGTELRIDTELNRLKSENHASELEIESLTQKCKEDAQILEELRVRNIENRNSLFSSFSGQHSPPLRWCRLDLDNYCVNSDNTTLFLKQRFEGKLNLMNFVSTENQNLKRLYTLQNLETVFIRHASAQFDAECDLKKVDVLIDLLSKPFQPMSFTLMSEQIERLTLQNEEIEENIENLGLSINEKIAYSAYQEAKFCEMENNKEKLRCAEKRLEILKMVSEPISSALILGDVLWLLLHSEMETMKNILENISMAHYEKENHQCARNVQILTRISSNSTEDLAGNEFSNKITELIEEAVGANGIKSDDLSNPFAKYTELINDHKVQLQHVISDSYQRKIVNLIKDFDTTSAQMNVFIGNGPSDKPNIWNLDILAESEVYKRKFDLMFASSRTMRHDFMEKYHQPFVNDELWKRRQLLWIWFLTDQKAFLEAFEKTVGDSKMINNRGRMSIVGGIKRQQ